MDNKTKKKLDAFILYIANDVLKGQSFTRYFIRNLVEHMFDDKKWDSDDLCDLDRTDEVYKSITRLSRKKSIVFVKNAKIEGKNFSDRVYKVNGVFTSGNSKKFLEVRE